MQTSNNLGASDGGNSVPSLLQRLLSVPTGPSTVDASSIQGQRSPMMDMPAITAASSLNRSADMTNTSSSDISRSSIVCPPKNVPSTIHQVLCRLKNGDFFEKIIRRCTATLRKVIKQNFFAVVTLLW